MAGFIRIYNVSNMHTGERIGFRISPQDTQISIAESILPFVVSLLIGKGKPANLEDYLKPFLEELIALQIEGLQFKEIFCYSIEVSSFVCETPARAFLKVITGRLQVVTRLHAFTAWCIFALNFQNLLIYF